MYIIRRMRVRAGRAACAMLALLLTAACNPLAGRQYEYEEQLYLSVDGSATIILDGVRAGGWRILVGDDAHALDAAVRADPIAAYLPGTTMASLIERVGRAAPDSGATPPAAASG